MKQIDLAKQDFSKCNDKVLGQTHSQINKVIDKTQICDLIYWPLYVPARDQIHEQVYVRIGEQVYEQINSETD